MRNTTFLLLGGVLLLLAACVPPSTPVPISATATPLTAPQNEAPREAIEAAVAQAMHARYAQFDAPQLVSTAVDRIVEADGWALADFAYQDTADREHYPDQPPTQWWRSRFVLQRDQAGHWQVVSIDAVPDDVQRRLWGPRQVLELASARITYYSFDEPYVQSAVTKEMDSYLAQVAQDLDAPLAGEPPLEVHLAPRNTVMWQETPEFRLWTLDSDIPSPGSAVADAGRYLRGGLAEVLASQLLMRSVGLDVVQAEPWPRLAFEIVVWEMQRVDDEVDRRAQMVQGIRDPAQERMPLSQLFDPGWTGTQSPGNHYWRQAAVTFVVETYGRQSLGPLARALFTEATWEDVVRTAFAEEPEQFEERWQAWLGQVGVAAVLQRAPTVARQLDSRYWFTLPDTVSWYSRRPVYESRSFDPCDPCIP